MDTSNTSTPTPTSQGAQHVTQEQAVASQREQNITQIANLTLEQFPGAPKDSIICKNRNDAERRINLAVEKRKERELSKAPDNTNAKILTYIWPSDSRFKSYGLFQCKEGEKGCGGPKLYPMNLTPSPETLKNLERFEENALDEIDLLPPSPEILSNTGLSKEILREIPPAAMCKDYDQARARRNKDMTKQTYIWPGDTKGSISVMQYNSKIPQEFSAEALSRVIKNFTWVEPKPKRRSTGFEGTESELKNTLKKLGVTDDILNMIPEYALCEDFQEVRKRTTEDDVRKTYMWVKDGKIKVKQYNYGLESYSPKTLAAAIKDIIWIEPETEVTKALTHVGVPRKCICEDYEDAETRMMSATSKLTYVWLNERTGGFDILGPVTSQGEKDKKENFSRNNSLEDIEKATKAGRINWGILSQEQTDSADRAKLPRWARSVLGTTPADAIEPKPRGQNTRVEGTKSELKNALRQLGVTDDTLNKIPESALCKDSNEVWKHQSVDDVRKTYMWVDNGLVCVAPYKSGQPIEQYLPDETLAAVVKDIIWVEPKTEVIKALTNAGVPRKCICDNFEDAEERRKIRIGADASGITYIWLNEETGGFDMMKTHIIPQGALQHEYVSLNNSLEDIKTMIKNGQINWGV